MNIALAGLTAREEVAMAMLVGKALPGWQCLSAPNKPHAPLPPADLCVLDLAGRGMARWTEAAQAELLTLLNGTPAVLVAPAFDQTWSALDTHRRRDQALVLLHKPYGIEAMRAALGQAAACRPRPLPALMPVLPAPSARARIANPVAALQPLHPQASVAALPQAKALPVPAAKLLPAAPTQVEGLLACSEFQARMGQLPGAPLFLRRLADALAQQHPFELRISFLSRMLFHPGEQWAASNAPAPVLMQLCEDDELASSVEIDAIDPQDAPARVLRLGMTTRPLQAVLWMLAYGLAGYAGQDV